MGNVFLSYELWIRFRQEQDKPINDQGGKLQGMALDEKMMIERIQRRVDRGDSVERAFKDFHQELASEYRGR